MLAVNTIGGTDTSSWYEIYQALIAVDQLCARHEPPLGGIALKLGELILVCMFENRGVLMRMMGEGKQEKLSVGLNRGFKTDGEGGGSAIV